MDESYRRQQWHGGVSDPFMWGYGAAPDLMRSASILWARFSDAQASVLRQASSTPRGQLDDISADIGLCSVAFMLAGFAVENLLKGLWVKRMSLETAFVEGDTRIKSLFKTHDLLSIANQAGVVLDVERKRLVRKLTTEIVWGGRYPRPKKPESLFPASHESPEGINMRSFSQSDWAAAEALYRDLSDSLFAGAEDLRR